MDELHKFQDQNPEVWKQSRAHLTYYIYWNVIVHLSRRTTENSWHSATRARSKKRTGCRSMYSAHWRLLSRQLFSVAPKAPWFRKVMPSSRSNAVPMPKHWFLGHWELIYVTVHLTVLNFRVRVICLHAASILLPQLERVGINPYQLSGAVLSPECPLFTLLNCKKQRTAYDKWQNKPKISAKAPPARNAFALLRRSGHLDLHWQHFGAIIS